MRQPADPDSERNFGRNGTNAAPTRDPPPAVVVDAVTKPVAIVRPLWRVVLSMVLAGLAMIVLLFTALCGRT